MSYPLFHEHGPSNLPVLMSEEDFRAAYPGETQHVEFKQGIPENKVREAVAAFSNTDGGVVLLGVTNQGSVAGLRADGELIARIHRIVAGVRDPGAYDVWTLRVGEKDVLVLSARRRREGFAQTADGRVLVRRGAMNAPLLGDELSRFLAGRSLARFESTPVVRTLADTDEDLVEAVREAHGWTSTNVAARLHEVGLLERLSDDSPLTVAGALYLLPRPADELGKALIEVFRYRAGETTYDRRTEFTGPAHQQVESAARAVMDELGADVVVLGLHRHELPRVPELVLREAIANAVAHRTYETGRQAIRIELHPDRVTIRSPGGLPEPVTVANMREQSAARNVDVIRVLRRFRLAEDAGMGVDAMQDAMDAAMLERPEFDAGADHVQVTLRLDSAVTPRERAWLTEIEGRGHIHSSDRLLLLHAARGELLTNSSVRQLLGVDSVHARASLQRLRDLGYLQQSGQRGGAHYTLDRDLGPPAGLQLDQEGLRDVIAAMAKDGPITNEQVRERVGLDRTRTLATLTSMVEAGILERHGQRRGTYYTLA